MALVPQRSLINTTMEMLPVVPSHWVSSFPLGSWGVLVPVHRALRSSRVCTTHITGAKENCLCIKTNIGII